MYKVASASEYLVITGCGIPDIKIAKKAWVLPGQSCTKFDVSPVNYTFEVQAMSAEKLPFVLPAVFTIGPRLDDQECLLKYAKLISPHDKLSHHVKELVQGIIEDSRFTQQELSACKRILSHGWIIRAFVSIGVIFIPIVLASLFASEQVHIFSRKARTETNL